MRGIFQQLATKGIVHQTGTGPRNFQWHLGAKGAGVQKKPAKEEPSRRR